MSEVRDIFFIFLRLKNYRYIHDTWFPGHVEVISCAQIGPRLSHSLVICALNTSVSSASKPFILNTEVIYTKDYFLSKPALHYEFIKKD